MRDVAIGNQYGSGCGCSGCVNSGDADIQFMTDNLRGAKEMPAVEVDNDGKLIVTTNGGKGINEKVVLTVINGDTAEFAINGHAFVASGSLQEIYEKVMPKLSVNERIPRTNLMDLIVPEAHAGGMSTSTLVLGAIALVAIVAAVYFAKKSGDLEKGYNRLKDRFKKK